MRIRVVVPTAAIVFLGSLAVFGCSSDSKGDAHEEGGRSAAAQLLTAAAPSTHYVNLTFSQPVGSAGADTNSYVIRDAGGALLPVTAASVDGSGTLVTLTTAAQQATQYQLLLAMDLGIGSAGFTGSIEGEPYLDSALSLSDTSLQLTFSERLDRQFAENPSSYRLLDPDTDQDVDIEITAAQLNDDLRTVVLTTTPQENRLYTVQVTNVKARFSCDDGDVSTMTTVAAGAMCAPALRPRTIDGALARVEVSARTGVDKSQSTNPTAPGNVGTVQTTVTGAGVGSASCSGNPCAAATGTSGHEELTISFDVPTRADSVVLTLPNLPMADFVLFVSSATASGFDYTIPAADLEAVAAGSVTELHFNQLDALPANLMIDQVRLRATASSSCLSTICVEDGRLIDPTRSLANFYGIPTVDNTAPRVVEAKSISATSVLVTFSEPLDNRAADPSHFSIGPNLVVTGAIQAEYQTQVLLSTTRQVADTEYTLTVTGVRDRARNAIDPAGNTATFRGISRELYLSTATALSPTSVQLVWSEPMDPATTENIANYDIADPDTDTDLDIHITGATASADGRTVVLTTTPQSNTVYEITATDIRAIRDDFYIDPTRNKAQFHGIPPEDTTPPRVVSAVSSGDSGVLVTFSEPLTVESADPANFSIPGLDVLAAVLTEQENQILLTTSAQVADQPYTLTVRNVLDKAHNAIVAGSDDSAVFVFDGRPETVDGSAPPRVVGAASTSNTTVVVTFSKAMSDDALVAANYVIVQLNVNPEVGTVSVASASFLGSDRTAVQLITRPQNEVTYLLTVTNVRDRAGNQLAPVELQANVMVNPSTAVFAGSPWSCGPRICSNGAPGLGAGQCGSDDDCAADAHCDVGDAPACLGACESMCSRPDPDGDGLSDNDEQRGWTIQVTLVDGNTSSRQVTSNPDVADTDGDGLSDDVERSIGTDPRDPDTDDDRINDYDEYNVVYSDPTRQDTDGDTLDDLLEVEFYKTNALVADSDGDGYEDGEELFDLHRDPRIADLPGQAISVGNIRLQLDHRFTYTDSQGTSQSSTRSTSSTLQNDTSSSTQKVSQTVGKFLIGVEGGLDACEEKELCAFPNRAKALIKFEGGAEFTSSTTVASARASSQAYAQGLEAGREISTSGEVSHEVAGASILADVSFTNTSDVAITLENVELRAATTDPDDPTQMVPLATLVPESALTTGQAQVLRLAAGQTLGPVVFANRDVYPALVEDLMRAPRGIVFNVAKYDLATSDGRNFAEGLQQVTDHTATLRIDKGDGIAKEHRMITAGVLDRPRDDLRCALTGSRPGVLCSIDADCGDSAPCEGGKIVGGFSEFAGTGGETPVPLDFLLRDTLGLRKARPAMILAGGTIAGSTAAGDDVQVVPVGSAVSRNQVVVSPGRNGVLESAVAGQDYNSEGMRLLAGDNGAVDSTAAGDDVQIIAVGFFPLAPADVVIAAGPNGRLDTVRAGDDVVIGPDGVRPGANRAVESFARGDDVQLIPFGTTGVPEDAVAIGAGADGVLQTLAAGDDTTDVITGYEVSRTCSANTPLRILAGTNGRADTTAEDGVCVLAYTPHFPGEQCTSDLQCGTDVATGNPGKCRSDAQTVAPGTGGLSPSAVVVQPDGALDPAGFAFLESVPAGDDVYVGPGIPCTVDADCAVPGASGTCDGSEQVVRYEERRRGQYRRSWALLMSDGSQLQTDFSAIRVRPGDQISLAFIQDIDRDGLIANEEFLHGSSDFRKDTDDDGLGDFSEVRIGWEFGVVGEPLRRTLPDPRFIDTDADGLSDLEEQDLRIARCACDAVGPKSLLGSGNLLRGASGTESARPCTSDAQCGGGTCRDALDCSGGSCATCPSDVTLFRTDARSPDTDGDRITDKDETFGYPTGAGIIDPSGAAAGKVLILAGPDLDADTRVCPQNHCIENTKHCVSDGDCESHACVHPVACDDMQVVPVGAGVRDPRTVVAVVAPSVAAASGDLKVTSGNALAQSTIFGDDLLVVGTGESVKVGSGCEDGGDFPFCSSLKPGANGLVDSVVGGDDVLVLGGSGQRRETSDPLSRDTDMDLVSDGAERRLGSSPNRPGDAAFGGDIDRDGLTDSVERAGWTVSVNGASLPGLRSSNPQLPDTDRDGLPDYAERYLPCRSGGGFCPTDPNEADTDGDGISDFDEVSRATLQNLAAYSELFSGFVLNPNESEAYGTDPNRTDTDGDGLSDDFELFTGWQVVRADGSVENVLSDPKNPDTDRDGLDDRGEYEGRPGSYASTDPGDPDTDGDGRLDGQETLIGSNPLRPDMSVTVTYANVELGFPSGGEDDTAEWKWGFFVQKPGQEFPGDEVSNQFDCPLYDSCLCVTYKAVPFVPLNKSVSVDLAPGEAIVLSGIVRETHDNRWLSCPYGFTSVYYSANAGDRSMSFVDEPITYEMLQGGQFMTRNITLQSAPSDPEITVKLLVEINVNCAGSGRHICREGSLCASDIDCESGHCDPDSNGMRRCVDYCGDGVQEPGEEACDDGNRESCGTCNKTCSREQTFPLCAGGIDCLDNADCASGTCVAVFPGGPKHCSEACGNGYVEGIEVCDDGNVLACGSCNQSCTAEQNNVTGCPVGTGCFKSSDCANGNCIEGKCRPICGNGVTETGEACDDRNVDVCGGCNSTCTAINAPAPGCAAGLGCRVAADCLSGTCTAGVCE